MYALERFVKYEWFGFKRNDDDYLYKVYYYYVFCQLYICMYTCQQFYGRRPLHKIMKKIKIQTL